MTALLGTIGLVVVAVVAVGYPLVYGARRQAMPVVEGERQRAELEARREALYAALKDLEFDHEMGKLSAKDYMALRERYTVQAVTVLQQLDALAAEEPPVVGKGYAAPDEELEREVAVRRRREATTAGPEVEVSTAEDGGIEREVVALRQAMKTKAPLVCPVCRRTCRPGDAFCAGCGASLAEVWEGRCPECSTH
jgi:hypothetical protein